MGLLIDHAEGLRRLVCRLLSLQAGLAADAITLSSYQTSHY